MLRVFVTACVMTVLLGVSGCSIPFTRESAAERKAACDRLAARAIDTESLSEAQELATSAASCYAEAAR